MTSYANTAEAVTPGNTNSAASTPAHNEDSALMSVDAEWARRSKMGAAAAAVALVTAELNTSSTHSTATDFDCDDCQSDEREKTDSTPENLKKIDDIIEQQHHQTANAAAAAIAPNMAASRADTGFRRTRMPAIYGDGVVGLAAALDVHDSPNSKTTLGSRKSDTFLKNELIESHSGNNCSNKSNNNNGNNEFKSGVPSLTHDDDSSATMNSMESTTTTTTATDTATTADSKQSFSFTIDSFDDKERDPALAAAKYRSMIARFQNRHRRGASLSNLETNNKEEQNETNDVRTKSTTPPPPLPKTLPPNAYNHSELPIALQRRSNNVAQTREAGRGGVAENVAKFEDAASGNKVKLRARSKTRIKDASKRHSWSPHTSSMQQSSATRSPNKSPTPPPRKTAAAATKKAAAAPAQHAKLLPPKAVAASNLLGNRTQQTFVPRSSVMQMALQKIDYMLPQPPLAEFKHLNEELDNASESGTYTLEGNNYTEEEKEIMNIDGGRTQRHRQTRPKDLKLKENSTKSALEKKRNVLEVNYYCDETAAAEEKKTQSSGDLLFGKHFKAGSAYLDNIKERVIRNISAPTQKKPLTAVNVSRTSTTAESPNENMGTFTSVTSSGVLAKQATLDPVPRATRVGKLSASQIDGSEYVSSSAIMKTSAASDSQKSQYRLQVFTTTRSSAAIEAQGADTPGSDNDTQTLASEAAALETAQSKNDWIQAWARNARARSLAAENKRFGNSAHATQEQPQDLMTRSYTQGGSEHMTDDNLYKQQQAKLNRTLAERLAAHTDFNYASDPALATCGKTQDVNMCYKPPKSPSKIPSPMHTLGRTRSACRSAALQQELQPSSEEEVNYLQHTATAINNLQQCLSRRGSLKSPPTNTASNSPHQLRAQQAARQTTRAGIYSPEHVDDSSPQHSLESPTYQRSPLQRRYRCPTTAHVSKAMPSAEQQLMTSSVNEQQLQLLISGEFLMKQMRARKNSLDGGSIEQTTPVRRAAAARQSPQHNAENVDVVAKHELSPLARARSYSAKIGKTARPQYQNIYTPPAARHKYGLSLAVDSGRGGERNIKKSASSQNFGQAYSDYDDNLEYYINDEDDVEDDDVDDDIEDVGEGGYYSSGAEEILSHEDGYYSHAENASAGGNHLLDNMTRSVPPPLSNTRCNKALLMRIERSKQKVAGVIASAPTSAQKSSAGVMACPNTPELPRRNVRSAPRTSGVAGATTRTSMPRDNSLSRLANQVPQSLASAKKQLLQTAATVSNNAAPPTGRASIGGTGQRSSSVQPKYLDISKYKVAQSNNFLRKNDARSTLKPALPTADIMKRSPSSSSMTRADPTRSSNRSIRSVGTTVGSNYSVGRSASSARRDTSVAKQRDAEMAMWKRRSSYDPMKAAAEDRRKREEAKRLAKAAVDSAPCESSQSLFNHQNSVEEEEHWACEEEEEEEDDENVFADSKNVAANNYV